MSKLKVLIYISFLLLSGLEAHAVIRTVTNENDNGSGSLRQAVIDANSGDTIVFVSGVNHIVLTTGQIHIQKDLTINGGSGNTRVTIDGNNNSRIFRILDASVDANNLTLINGYSNSGVAVIIDGVSTLNVTNCTFTENSHNNAMGGAVYVAHSASTFIVVNCTFSQNSAFNGGAVDNHGTLVAINCTFYSNFASGGGGGICIHGTTFLYHCTFDMNQPSNTAGRFYSYNCLYAPQIGGTIITGINLGETRDIIFGENQFDATVGYIIPLVYAKSATKLNYILAPAGIDANQILTWLAADQQGYARPTIGYVTYGAIEVGLALTVEATAGGSTTPSGTSVRDSNEIVEVLAIPTDDCYTFKHWVDKNDGIVSTENPLNVEILSDTLLKAVFVDTISATLIINPPGTGAILTKTATVTDTGLVYYHCNDAVVIEAIASECYRLLYWTKPNGLIFSTNAKDTMTIASNDTLIANFVIDTFDLRVTSIPKSDKLIVDGAGRYNCNTPAIIRAFTSSDCYKFLHWRDTVTQEIVSEKAIDTIFIRNNLDLAAVFYSDTTFKVHLLASPTNAGTVTHSGVYDCETEVSISATVTAECYRFKNWTTEDGTVISTSATFSFTVTCDTNLMANFERVDDFEVKLSPNPANGGTVAGARKFACPGGVASISATANAGFEFVNWTDAVTGVVLSSNPVVNFSVYRDFDLIANFVGNTNGYLVSLYSEPTVAGVLIGAGLYEFDEKVNIRAVANEGYVFRYWSNFAGDTISRNAEFALTVVSDTSLFAHFRLRSFSVSVQASPINMGTVTGTTSGAYSYNYAGVSTATSTDDTLFVFANWTGRAIAAGSKLDTLSNEPTLHFFVKSDTIVVANFDIKISVEENIKIETISIVPNPTRDDFTVSFEVVKSGNIEVMLLDLSGREVLLIHNDFAHEGTFSRTINTANLSRGVYYLKVQVGKNFTVEKVVVE